MEILESIGWVAMGFAPTIIAMEVAWKIRSKGIAGGIRDPKVGKIKEGAKGSGLIPRF